MKTILIFLLLGLCGCASLDNPRFNPRAREYPAERAKVAAMNDGELAGYVASRRWWHLQFIAREELAKRDPTNTPR